MKWTKDATFIHIHELQDNLKASPKSQRRPLLSTRLLVSRKINIIIPLLRVKLTLRNGNLPLELPLHVLWQPGIQQADPAEISFRL